MPILDSFPKLEARPSGAGPALSAPPPSHAEPAQCPTWECFLTGWRQGAALSQLQAVLSSVLVAIHASFKDKGTLASSGMWSFKSLGKSCTSTYCLPRAKRSAAQLLCSPCCPRPPDKMLPG